MKTLWPILFVAIPILATAQSRLDLLCDNHYNKRGLKPGKFEQIKAIVDSDKKAAPQELIAQLNAPDITLNEASWGLYYLGQKSLDQDFKLFVKYLTVAADDYLNPWAMTLLAKVYYYDKESWKKQYPRADVVTDRDLDKSYAYLSLAFLIAGETEQDHRDNAILTGVANGGLALKDTFEGTGVQGFDVRASLARHRTELAQKAQMYRKLYR